MGDNLLYLGAGLAFGLVLCFLFAKAVKRLFK